METITQDLVFTLVVTIVVFIFVWSYIKLSTEVCRCDTDLTGKIAIVTGANTGIGFQTAKALAKLGAKVILACRDKKKGLQAEHQIRTETGSTNVFYKHLDLASFASISRFAEDIIRTEKFVNILINNAGTGTLDNALTDDNLPIEVQINHYGPFLLTLGESRHYFFFKKGFKKKCTNPTCSPLLLLPLLKKRSYSRIVNVSSIMHNIGKVDPDNFHKQANTFLEWRRVYSNTKLANMLFTLKLSKLLEGTTVTVNCLHPGAVFTDIFRHQPYLIKIVLRWLMKSPWEGAQTVIHLAVASKLANTSGKYFVECEEKKPATRALDMEVAERLWKTSEKIVERYLQRAGGEYVMADVYFNI